MILYIDMPLNPSIVLLMRPNWFMPKVAKFVKLSLIPQRNYFLNCLDLHNDTTSKWQYFLKCLMTIQRPRHVGSINKYVLWKSLTIVWKVYSKQLHWHRAICTNDYCFLLGLTFSEFPVTCCDGIRSSDIWLLRWNLHVWDLRILRRHVCLFPN